MTLSASYMVQQVRQLNNAVNWNNGFWGNGIDTTWLPPDNNYQRLALNATWRQLPWNSSLGVPLHVGQDGERPRTSARPS